MEVLGPSGIETVYKNKQIYNMLTMCLNHSLNRLCTWPDIMFHHRSAGCKTYSPFFSICYSFCCFV